METQISEFTFDTSHVDSIIKLGSTYYPSNYQGLKQSYLNWFYGNNPNGPASLIVAHEDNSWIGLIVLIPIILHYKQQEQKACFAVNVLTHPEHRAKNLFVKMISFAKANLIKKGIWILGHPNANAIPGWRRHKMDFRQSLHPYLIKFNTPLSNKKIKKIKINSIEQLQGLPKSFWEIEKKSTKVSIAYSPEFIAWRFLNATDSQYKIILIEMNGVPIGLKITRRFKLFFDLVVDFIPSKHEYSSYAGLLANFFQFDIIVLSRDSYLTKFCWQLPVKKNIPFFLTTFKNDILDLDASNITMSATDF